MLDLKWGRLAAMALVLGASACKDGTDDPTDETDVDTDETDVTCTSAIRPVLPTAGATEVYYRTAFAVEFTEAEATTAAFTLVKASDSSDVPLSEVTWSTSGKQASFTASEPLAPSTQYKLQITYSCSVDGVASEIAFTTSATGSAVSDTSAFLGETYAIDLSTATIIEPAGVNQLLGSLLGQLEDVIAVVPGPLVDTELSFFGGLASDTGEQDQCQTTIEFPEAAEFQNPFFQIVAPDGIDLSFEGIAIELLELDLSGSFNPDASSIEGITLAGSIDTRGLIAVLGDQLGGETGDDAVCNLLGTFTNNAVQCEACPGGGGDFCLSLVAANITADKQTWDLEEITQADIDENPACDVAAAQ